MSHCQLARHSRQSYDRKVIPPDEAGIFSIPWNIGSEETVCVCDYVSLKNWWNWIPAEQLDGRLQQIKKGECCLKNKT